MSAETQKYRKSGETSQTTIRVDSKSLRKFQRACKRLGKSQSWGWHVLLHSVRETFENHIEQQKKG